MIPTYKGEDIKKKQKTTKRMMKAMEKKKKYKTKKDMGMEKLKTKTKIRMTLLDWYYLILVIKGET